MFSKRCIILNVVAMLNQSQIQRLYINRTVMVFDKKTLNATFGTYSTDVYLAVMMIRAPGFNNFTRNYLHHIPYHNGFIKEDNLKERQWMTITFTDNEVDEVFREDSIDKGSVF
uniref:Uncharacterized protein n=1 Tax=Xenopus tropicalis TaxID=8364 RepID=A0A803JAC2_XENTR